MGLLLVVGVLQLGLQATGARRIAAHPEDVAEIEHNLRRVTWGASIGLALLCLALTPVINAALHLDSLATASLVALVALPMTVMGGQAGILQGERRWTALALVYLAAGVPRLVIGTALLLWRPTEFWAVMGVAIGFVAPTVVGWLALRDPRSGHVPDTYGGHGGWSVLRETAAQLARAVCLLRPLQRRRDRRPQRARRPRVGPVRRWPDPGEGGAVPPPVRRGGCVPVDVDASRPGARPCCAASAW